MSTPEPPTAESLQAPSALALLRVFRHRNYRLFFSGQLVSLMGTWMPSIAQGWLVYALSHSPFLLGLTSFAGMVPVFFITSFGGMVADRVDRRRLLMVTQSLAMLQAATLAVLALTGLSARCGGSGRAGRRTRGTTPPRAAGPSRRRSRPDSSSRCRRSSTRVNG